MTLSPSLDDWQPYPVGDVTALFAGSPFRWWVSGGVALELHFGRNWRDHADTDIGVLRTDVARVYDWMTGWELAVAAGAGCDPTVETMTRTISQRSAGSTTTLWCIGSASGSTRNPLRSGDDSSATSQWCRSSDLVSPPRSGVGGAFRRIRYTS